MKLFPVQFSPVSYTSYLFGPNILFISPFSAFRWGRSRFTLKHNNRWNNRFVYCNVYRFRFL